MRRVSVGVSGTAVLPVADTAVPAPLLPRLRASVVAGDTTGAATAAAPHATATSPGECGEDDGGGRGGGVGGGGSGAGGGSSHVPSEGVRRRRSDTDATGVGTLSAVGIRGGRCEVAVGDSADTFDSKLLAYDM